MNRQDKDARAEAPRANGSVPLRRPVSTLSQRPNDLSQLVAAYQALGKLGDSDPRSLLNLSILHRNMCSGTADIHANWYFLAWHRGFVRFHERVLGSLIQNPQFRLPYWDWDGPSRTVPPEYNDPSLSDFRQPLPTDMDTTQTVDPVKAYMSPLIDFSQFGGGINCVAPAICSGLAATGPHQYVHTYVGGDMATAPQAALDPLFYIHHTNVDRIWEMWLHASTAHVNPTDAAWLNTSFPFTDENAKSVSVRIGDLLDINTLGYGYESIVPPARFSPDSEPLASLTSVNKTFPPAAIETLSARLREDRGARIVLLLSVKGIMWPDNSKARYFDVVLRSGETSTKIGLLSHPFMPGGHMMNHSQGSVFTIDPQRLVEAMHANPQVVLELTAPGERAAKQLMYASAEFNICWTEA